MKKVALVTGGMRGIGLGIARCLAKEGYDLAICGTREESSVSAKKAELEQLGALVTYVRADIGDSGSRARLVDALKARPGALHVLVNNAGVAPKERKDILEATEDSYDYVMQTNLKGPYFLTQAVANWMIRQKNASPAYRGCIINITSISATAASPNRGEYCLSKAALAMSSALWAVRLAEFDIPVYEVRPGIIQTDRTAGVREKYDRLIEAGLLLQHRWGTPDDVGKAVAMLARGDAPYSTGQVLMVDGGFSVERL